VMELLLKDGLGAGRIVQNQNTFFSFIHLHPLLQHCPRLRLHLI
jgi:hypothetical protein